VGLPPSITTEPTGVHGSPSSVVAASGPRAWICRPLIACLVLLACYVTCTFALNDPRGTLGTDTGGKLATCT